MVTRIELDLALKELLKPENFQDYAPNGLQVQGGESIQRLVTGVTASQALLDRAVSLQAQAVLVHHGYFWKGESAALTGIKYQRVKTLIQHDINLFAYHLPLDAHPELGNNAQLAERLGITITGGLQPGSPYPIGNQGALDELCSGVELAQRITAELDHPVIHVAGNERPIKRLAWCTGGAQGYIDQAVALGVDAYISGEISEPTTHIARENGLHYFAAGHHATERYGVRAVGDWLAAELGVEHEFVDIPNPA